MFGFGRSLRKVGVRAYADVLAAEQSSLSVTVGNPNLLGNTEIRWKLQLRVLPQSEPPFDATVRALLPQLNQPRPGTRVAVLYDPKDHGRVELDQRPAALVGDGLETLVAGDVGEVQRSLAVLEAVDVGGADGAKLRQRPRAKAPGQEWTLTPAGNL